MCEERNARSIARLQNASRTGKNTRARHQPVTVLGRIGFDSRRLYDQGRGETQLVEIAPRIAVDEKVLFGKQVIQGTRVPGDLLLDKLAGGLTLEDVMKEYDLTREDALAALAYAARAVADEQVRAVE